MSGRDMTSLEYMKEDKTSLSGLKLLVAKQAEIIASIRDWIRDGEKIAEMMEEYLKLHEQIMDLGMVYDFSRIRWVSTEGPSGPYEYADASDNRDNDDFKLLVADLKKHEGGRMTRDGYFIWLFSKADRVGRKPSRKKQKS